jgi:phospholipid transport system substrate-binding protein
MLPFSQRASASGVTATPQERTMPASEQVTLQRHTATECPGSPDRDRVLQLARTRVLAHFDFERMTRLAVGRAWSQATKAQRERLQDEFRDLLVRTYTNALAAAGHRDLGVEVHPVRRENGTNEATVDTRLIRAGAPPVRVTYRMEHQPPGWKVYDVVVEGMSLVTTYRHSFRNEVQKGGIEGLIRALDEKNESLAAG